MTKKEKINRNIGLTFDFLRHVVDNPSIIETIPDGATLEFIEKDFAITNETSLNNKYLIKVKTVFEPLNKVAEPDAPYQKNQSSK